MKAPKGGLLALSLLLSEAPLLPGPPSVREGPSLLPPLLASARRPQTAVASFYHDSLHRRLTASGSRYDKRAFTAAHRTLPFGTRLLLKANGRFVLVTITDRGPFWPGRDIDLSRRAAQELGFIHEGLASVEVFPL